MDLFNSENTNDSQGSPDTGRVRLKGGKSRYSARELLIDDDELDEELNNENGDRAYNSLTSSAGNSESFWSTYKRGKEQRKLCLIVTAALVIALIALVVAVVGILYTKSHMGEFEEQISLLNTKSQSSDGGLSSPSSTESSPSAQRQKQETPPDTKATAITELEERLDNLTSVVTDLHDKLIDQAKNSKMIMKQFADVQMMIQNESIAMSGHMTDLIAGLTSQFNQTLSGELSGIMGDLSADMMSSLDNLTSIAENIGLLNQTIEGKVNDLYASLDNVYELIANISDTEKAIVTPRHYWSQENINSYLKVTDMPSMSEFTACFYYEPNHLGGVRLITGSSRQFLISIASRYNHNEFLFGFYESPSRCMRVERGGSQHAITEGLESFNEPHRHCFVWKDAHYLKWFHDAHIPGIMELTAEVGDPGGENIPAGSIMVLLNDQDSFGGDLETSQMIPGHLADFQMWNRAFSNLEVLALGCTEKGNVVAFEYDVEIMGSSRLQVGGNFQCSYRNISHTEANTSATCPQNYYLNPYTDTCLRLVTSQVTWSTAKGACESTGEKLVTFPTLQSSQWFDTFKANTSLPYAWRSQRMWIGLSLVGSEWKWQGLITDILSNRDSRWSQANNEPDATQGYHCGYVAYAYQQGVLDYACHNTYNYICEKAL